MARLRWRHLCASALGVTLPVPAGQLTWPVAAVLITIIVAIVIICLTALLRLGALPKIRRNGKYCFTVQWEQMGFAKRQQPNKPEEQVRGRPGRSRWRNR
jgi:membrane protein YdbS with pleckstrin-like domain